MESGGTILLPMLALGIAIIVWSLIRAFRSFAPWIPSSPAMAERALDFIRPKEGTTFADLGCGDGRILFFVNKKYGLTATGFEISILPYCLAVARKILTGKTNVSIFFKNLYQADISSFDIIYVYGLPEALRKRLVPKLEKEVKRGAYIISYNFSFEHKVPIATIRDRWRNVFIYTF